VQAPPGNGSRSRPAKSRMTVLLPVPGHRRKQTAARRRVNLASNLSGTASGPRSRDCSIPPTRYRKWPAELLGFNFSVSSNLSPRRMKGIRPNLPWNSPARLAGRGSRSTLRPRPSCPWLPVRSFAEHARELLPRERANDFDHLSICRSSLLALASKLPQKHENPVRQLFRRRAEKGPSDGGPSLNE
jgi:hypothetical protein